MKRPRRWIALAQTLIVLALGSVGACSAQKTDAMPGMAGMPGMAPAKIPAGADYTAGDVAFMQGMIHHHSQAIQMAKMAPTHGASSRVTLLCQKIALAQADEIKMMRFWLEYRHQQVPDSTAPPMMMPGMLTPEQFKALEQVKDTAFDRLFLQGMIQHHQGAIKMVADLLASPPSGQESEIFRFITDVDTDQRAEIGVMQQMLYNLQGSSPQ